MFWKKKKLPVEWELRFTSPDGVLLAVTTAQLEAIWRLGDRSNDGFVDILQWRIPRLHLWVKPAGYVEPDRSVLLDGNDALPDAMRRRM